MIQLHFGQQNKKKSKKFITKAIVNDDNSDIEKMQVQSKESVSYILIIILCLENLLQVIFKNVSKT